MNVTIHIDGGSRGNPGPAAAGVVLRDSDSGKVIHEAAYVLGRTTNNVAEYTALLRAIDLASEYKARELQVVLASCDAPPADQHHDAELAEPKTLLARLQADIRGDSSPPDDADDRAPLDPDDTSASFESIPTTP